MLWLLSAKKGTQNENKRYSEKDEKTTRYRNQRENGKT